MTHLTSMVGLHGALLQASLSQAQAQVMPLILLALLLDFTIVVLWYLIGVLISNSSVKQSALGELYQFVSTSIMVLIVVGVLYVAATIFAATFAPSSFLGASTMSALCTSIAGNTNFYTPGALLTTPLNICSLTAHIQKNVTTEIDYPLSATSIINSDMLLQTGVNLNSTYIVDAYIRFLSKLNPTLAVCGQIAPQLKNGIPDTPQWLASGGFVVYGGAPCTPIPAQVNYTFYIKASSTPWSGYDMISSSLGTLATLMSTAIGIFVAQGLLTSIMLFLWPWLLFAGIAFRATPFTRRLGGLLIAIAIGTVLIYPTLVMVEVIASQGSPSNVFSFPNVQNIASSDGCWPISGSLQTQETADVTYLTTVGPVIGVFGDLYQLFTGSVSQAGPLDWMFVYNPNNFIPYTCAPNQALNTVLDLFNAYGILGVTGFFLPILNLIITFSAIRSLSGLLGGDTDLAGLSKLF